jgi:hypothetical protein
MFFGEVPPEEQEQPTQGFFGAMGQKVQEADQFVRNLQPENAQALLVAGLSLLDNQSAGKAGLNALNARQGLIQQNQRQENLKLNRDLRERQIAAQQGISQQNANTAAMNAQTARGNAASSYLRAKTAAERASDPLSSAGKLYADYEALLAAGDTEGANRVLELGQRNGQEFTFDPESGRLTGIRFGGSKKTSGSDGVTKATQSDLEAARDRGNKAFKILDSLDAAVKNADESSFGWLGRKREQLAGISSQFGFKDFSDWVRPSDDIQTQARVAETMFAQVFIDEPRVTDQDIGRIRTLLQIANDSGSKERAAEAVQDIKVIYDDILSRPAPGAGGGFVPPGAAGGGVPTMEELFNSSMKPQ